MRKLLLSLSSLAIAATTAMTVVACDTTDASEFISWANSTRATENNQSSTMVVYIGSENNASSKSFEKAMKMITGTDDIYQAFDFINGDQHVADGAYNDVISLLRKIDENYTPFQSGVEPRKEVNVEKNKDGKWIATGRKENEPDLFNKENHDTSKFSFRAIKVSNVDSLWTEDDAMTYSILNDYIIPSMAKTLYSYFWRTENNEVNNDINTKIDEMVTQIKSLKGPLFLTITDGQLISITNGFQVEAQFAANPQSVNTQNWDHDAIEGKKQLIQTLKGEDGFITKSIGAGSTSFSLSNETEYNIVHDSGWGDRTENGKEVEKRSSLSYSIDHNKYN